MDFTCEVCGKQVSKRQSYATESGRACKVHKDIQEAVRLRVMKEKEELQKRVPVKELLRRERDMRVRAFTEAAEKHNTNCWFCGCKVIPSAHLRATKKAVLEYLRELFPGAPDEHLPFEEALDLVLDDRVVAEVVPIRSIDHIASHPVFRPIRDYVGHALVCHACLLNFQIPINAQGE